MRQIRHMHRTPFPSPDVDFFFIVQRAGAAALVVVDGGGCAKYDQRCLPGASKAHDEGFGALDVKAHW